MLFEYDRSLREHDALYHDTSDLADDFDERLLITPAQNPYEFEPEDTFLVLED